MPSVCLLFQVHQPSLLKHYTVFDIGRNHLYEDQEKNRRVLDQLADSCYLPVNAILLQLIEKYEGEFRVALSISGSIIDLCEKYREDILEGFRRLTDTGCVEFLNETYPHSLAFLFSPGEFREQIDLHKKKIRELFGQNSTTFRCTELIYNNELACIAEEMGYSTMLAAGKEGLSGFEGPNFIYSPVNCAKLKLLLRNYRLSDDIRFCFSDRGQEGRPPTAGWFVQRMVRACNDDRGQVVNLFMDYETFGNYQRPDKGILEFLQALPAEVLCHPDLCFHTPSEIEERYDPVALLDVPDFVSWSDGKRDLTAWVGNAMQKDALRALYDLEEAVRKRKDADCLAIWRMLQTSNHFYYMSMEGFADGTKQEYSNPYASPYEAYINYMNILDDFSRTLQS